MKLLLVHNSYQQPGGEDQVFRLEGDLLRDHAHEVVTYTDHNDRLEELSALQAAGNTLWSRRGHEEVLALIRRERPEIMHVHNTFPLISPSIYYAAARERVAVVQTLHNYRFLCPQSDFIRDGRVCEDCLGRGIPWPGVLHACYRGSRVASTGAAAMLSLHRLMGTYQRKIHAYIALTEFGKRKFIEGGLPADRIFVKPNFVHPDPGPGKGAGGYALYVGRLSSSKGVEVLLKAWEELTDELPLRIIGSGPLDELVSGRVARLKNVEWYGRRPWDEVLTHMQGALVLVFPSEWYEGFPLTIAEAFATGLPVVASDLGAMSSIIESGRTGLHFRPGDPRDLADKVRWVAAHRADVERMRREARKEYQTKYTAERNYEQLMQIYDSARAA